MSSFFSNYLENVSIVDVIQLYGYNSILYFSNLIVHLKELHNKTLTTITEINLGNIYFDNFQWELLKIFSFFLLVNILLILIVWKIYGKSICDRFMNLSTFKGIDEPTATLREIEELKASVSKLKLPKEYTPRY